MKKLLIYLLTGFIIFSLAGVGNATVLTFDDILTSGVTSQIETVAPNYGGFSWDLTSVILGNYYSGSGYDTGTISGNYVAWNFLDTTTVSSKDVFDFNGAYFNSAWQPQDITVEGYLNNTKLYERTIPVNTLNPVWMDSNFVDVDTLKIISSNPNSHWVMDNFTFNEPVSAHAPEPATMILLGSGLAGFVAFRRRFKK